MQVYYFFFIAGHLLLASVSFFWACCCLGTTPKIKITDWTKSPGTGELCSFFGDAAFLIYLLKEAGCYFVDTVVELIRDEAKTSDVDQHLLDNWLMYAERNGKRVLVNVSLKTCS